MSGCFYKGLTNPKNFSDERSAFMKVGKAENIAYLNFSAKFNTVLCNVIHRLMKCGLDMWIVR